MNTATNLYDSLGEQSSTAADGGRTAESLAVKILIAHEDPAQANATKAVFKNLGWKMHAHRITSIEDLDDSLRNSEWNLIIAFANSRMYQPAIIGNYIEKYSSQVHAIFLDDSYSPETAWQIVQCGFRDYLTSAETDRLAFVAERELQAQRDHQLARQAGEVLAEANARSELLMNSTAEAIAYVIDGMIVNVNTAFAEQLQFESADDLDCYPFIDLVAEKDQMIIRPLLRDKQLGDAEESQASVELVKSDGSCFGVELNLNLASFEGDPCTQVLFSPQARSAAAQPAAEHSGSVEFDLEKLAGVAGRGSLFFASISSNAVQRKTLGLDNHLQQIKEIASLIRSQVPEQAQVFDYLKESWVITIPADCEHEPTAFAQQLCDLVSNHKIDGEKSSFNVALAVGISQFGVADISVESALQRAFKACAEKQLEGDSGFKLFVPKLDNAEGAAALESALALKRLALKYQPIVALQEQTHHCYDTVVYIQKDSGEEESAEQLLSGLGIEKQNAALDRWLIEEAITAVQNRAEVSTPIELHVALSASAIIDESFYPWMVQQVAASGIPAGNFVFSIKASDAMDYEKRAREIVVKLKDDQFKVGVHSATLEHMATIKQLHPEFVLMSSELTVAMNGEEAEPQLIKDMISQSQEARAQCIASGVNSAGELAQLWQTGVEYVQGNYLEAPLDAMDYEFSDIA